MFSFVLMHEVAHVALGHLDWLDQHGRPGMLAEFGFFPIDEEDCNQIQILEGDADRLATVLTSSMIDYATNQNPYLRYSSLADQFYDIGYMYGSLFAFLEAIQPKVPSSKRTHPEPHIRFGIVLAFVEEYLEKYHPSGTKVLHQHAISGGLDALSRIQHSEKGLFDPLSVVAFMFAAGEGIESMNIRKYRHEVSSTDQGSFYGLQ